MLSETARLGIEVLLLSWPEFYEFVNVGLTVAFLPADHHGHEHPGFCPAPQGRVADFQRLFHGVGSDIHFIAGFMPSGYFKLVLLACLGNELAGECVQVRELQADGCSRDFLNKSDEIQIIRFHFFENYLVCLSRRTNRCPPHLATVDFERRRLSLNKIQRCKFLPECSINCKTGL